MVDTTQELDLEWKLDEKDMIDLIPESVEHIDPVEEENANKTRDTIADFVGSYARKPETQSNLDWLDGAFAKHKGLWNSEEERRNDAKEIVDTVNGFFKRKEELETHIASGKSRESWIAKSLEVSATAQGIKDVGEYAGQIDYELQTANKANVDLVHTMNGSINMQSNLDGFLAEQHHVNTFNLDAATKGSTLRAKVLVPEGAYGKNSVDIAIYDEKAPTQYLKRYQVKYCKDAEATLDALKGRYPGQSWLVDKNQAKDIPNAHEKIELNGVSSKPATKAEMKKWQESAQENERVRTKRYNWNKDIDKLTVCKAIARNSALSATIAVVLQGARIAGKRFLNWVTDKENRPVEEDVKEFVTSSLESGATAGMTTAVAGGMHVAAKSGWLGPALGKTMVATKIPGVNTIATTACLAVESVKSLYKYGKGEITGKQVIDNMGNATCSLIGGIKGFSLGATAGASLGICLGPVGMAVGGFVGGCIGSVTGTGVGRAVWKGAKAAVKVIKSAGKAAVKVFKSAGKALGKAFSR